MPEIRFSTEDIEFHELLEAWRRDQIPRRDAVERFVELKGWSRAYVEKFLDDQWLPPGRR